MTVRKDPPRWSKLPVWLAAMVAAWAVLFVLWRAVVVWPWPTGCLFAGLLLGLLAGGRWRRQLRAELESERATVDRWNHGDTLYTLDEVGRIEPDRPEPVLFDQDAEYPLAEALGNVGRVIGEHAGPVAATFVDLAVPPGNVVSGGRPIAMTGERDTDRQDRELSDIYGAHDGTWSGASHLQADPADDTGEGTVAHLRSGEWAPATPAPKRVGQ